MKKSSRKYLILCDYRQLLLLMGTHFRCGIHSSLKILTHALIRQIGSWFDPYDRAWLYYRRIYPNQQWSVIAFRKSNELWMPLLPPERTIRNGYFGYYFPSRLYIDGQWKHAHNEQCLDCCQIQTLRYIVFNGTATLTIVDHLDNMIINCHEWHMGDYDDSLEVGRNITYYFQNHPEKTFNVVDFIDNHHDYGVMPIKWLQQNHVPSNMTLRQFNNLRNGVIIVSKLAWFLRIMAMNERWIVDPDKEIDNFYATINQMLPRKLFQRIDVFHV